MSTGFSKDGLTRLDAAMERHVQDGVPGVVAALDRGGKTHLTVTGQGYAEDTIFRIASISKPIAAVAAMILVEECRIRLDEPIDRFLPELADRRVLNSLEGDPNDTVPANRAITLRDILTFRMGTGFVFAPPDRYPFQTVYAEQLGPAGPPHPDQTPAPDEWIARFAKLPLLAQPGEEWHYHLAAEVLGVLIGRVAEQPFEAFLKERVLDPLGMKDTGFYVPAEKVQRLPDCIWTNYQTGKQEIFDSTNGGWSTPPKFASAGGGMVSTAADMLAFGRMLRGGGAPILARPTVELMTMNHLGAAQQTRGADILGEGKGWGFGMGVVTHRVGYPNVGSFGWDGGLGTSFLVDPKEDLIGVLFTQKAWSNPTPPPVCADFWTSAYSAIVS